MRRTGILVIQLLIAVALLEGALRIYQPLPFRLRGDVIVLPVGLQYHFSNAGDPKLDPETTHTRNRLGFRGPDPPADFASRLTIVAVGGSTTECFRLSDGKTWPEVMAAEMSKSRPDVWVNNAGLDGHSTVGHLAVLTTVLVPLRPKVMLVLAGLNDVGLEDLRPEDEVAGVYPYFRPFWQRLANASELANTLLNLERARRARAMGFRHDPVDFTAVRHLAMDDADVAAAVTRMTRQIPRYDARLTALIRTARSAQIEPVLITQPSLGGEGLDPTTGTDLATIAERADHNALADWRALERYNDVMRRVAERDGVFLIDLARRLPKDSKYFLDTMHFSNDGAARVGHLVATALGPHLIR